MENAKTMGEYLISKLCELQKSIECIGDVRGKGLMVGIEIVKNRQMKEKAPDWRNKIIKKAFEKGLLLLGCGENTIRFSPALTVTAEEMDVCLTIFEEVLLEITK